MEKILISNKAELIKSALEFGSDFEGVEVFYTPNFVDHVIGSVEDVDLPFELALEEYIEKLELERLEFNMFGLVCDEVVHEPNRTIFRFSALSLIKTRTHPKAERWMMEYWLNEEIDNLEVEFTIEAEEAIKLLLENEASDYVNVTDDWKENLIQVVEILQPKECD